MNRMKELREHKKISMKEAAVGIGLPYTTYVGYEKGEREPNSEMLIKIASFYSVTVDYLIGRKDKEKQLSNKKKYLVPVLGDVPAGVPIEAIEDILDYEEISEDMALSGDHFGLRIKGDSMEPRMSDGDVVIVRRQEQVENGQIAVVLVNGDNATVKKFFKSEIGVTLIGTNPSFSPLIYTPEQVEQLPVRVIGRVVELRAKF